MFGIDALPGEWEVSEVVWRDGMAYYEFDRDDCDGTVRFASKTSRAEALMSGVPNGVLYVWIRNKGEDKLLVAPSKNPTVHLTRKGKREQLKPLSKHEVLADLAVVQGPESATYQAFENNLVEATTLLPGESLAGAIAYRFKASADSKLDLALTCNRHVIRTELAVNP